jgi:hypothetical protein
MKYLLFTVLLLQSVITTYGQALKKYPIGKSGCSAYFYSNPGKFDITTTEDSSIMYAAECTAANVTYEVICIKLKQKATNLDRAAEVLEQYLEYLKGSYTITTSEGYIRGLRLQKKESTRGIKDTWGDLDRNHIKVKGWTNGRFMVVLMVLSPEELNKAKTDKYLDGLLFPGM